MQNVLKEGEREGKGKKGNMELLFQKKKKEKIKK